jgi:hypothetical protein
VRKGSDSVPMGWWGRAAGMLVALVMLLVMYLPATALSSPIPHATSTGWAGPLKIDSAQVQGLSCPSTSFCAAIDVNGDMVTFNGGVWGAPAPESLQGGQILQAISCTSASFCAGIDGNEDAYVYNGQGWSAPSKLTTDPGDDGTVTSVSCGSSTFCVAVGGYTSDESFTYDGGTWGPADTFYTSAGADTTYATTISCAGNLCAAGDFKGQLFTLSVGVWSGPTPTVTNHTIFSVSCGAGLFCVASADGSTFAFNGGVWSAATSSPPIMTLACVDAAFCEGLAGEGASTYDGSSWGTLVSDVNGPAVSCATATFCVAAGAAGAVFTYSGGSSGTTPPASGKPGSATLTGVAVSGTTASIVLSCRGAAGAHCVGTVTERAKLRVRVGGHYRTRTETLASGAYALTAGKRATVRLKLDRSGRNALASAGKLKVSLVVLAGTGTSAKTLVTRSLTYR